MFITINKMDYNTKEIKPEKLINPKHVVYWAEKEGILLGDMRSKAQKFLEYGCVLETPIPNRFVVKFLPGYNVTNHQINLDPKSGEINGTCTCQASRRNHIECSHIKAVKLYIFQRRWNERIL